MVAPRVPPPPRDTPERSRMSFVVKKPTQLSGRRCEPGEIVHITTDAGSGYYAVAIEPLLRDGVLEVCREIPTTLVYVVEKRFAYYGVAYEEGNLLKLQSPVTADVLHTIDDLVRSGYLKPAFKKDYVPNRDPQQRKIRIRGN